MGAGNTKELPYVIQSQVTTSSVAMHTRMESQISVCHEHRIVDNEPEVEGNQRKNSKNKPENDPSGMGVEAMTALQGLLRLDTDCSKKHLVSVFVKPVSENFDYSRTNNNRRIILGNGLHGAVFRIERKLDKREFAFKTVSFSNSDHAVVEELKNELQILGSMDHPHIAKLYEVYILNPRQIGMVLELGYGGDLYYVLEERGTFEESECIALVIQMLDAVMYLHGRNILHRDLKLENWVFADKASSVLKLIDFGLGYTAKPDEKCSNSVGTCYYMAPEVLMKNYDLRCDLWSLGVIVFMMLTGRPPFIGVDDNETYEMVLHGAPSVMQDDWWEGIGVTARSFVSGLLTLNPDKRFSAETASKHEWLKPRVSQRNVNIVEESELVECANKMVKFSKFPFIKKIALILIAGDLEHTNPSYNKAWKIFSYLNDDHTGRISSARLEAVLSPLCPGCKCNEIFTQLDCHGNGYLEWSEILSVFVEDTLVMPNAKMDTTILRIFYRMAQCKNEKAKILRKHMEQLLARRMTDDFVKQIFLEIDPSGSGSIDLATFRKMFEPVRETEQK